MANASSAQTGFLGGIISMDSGTDDEIKQRYYNDLLQGKLDTYLQQFYKPKEIKGLNTAYTAAYNANNPAAVANAQYYTGLTKDILGDKSDYMSDYERIRGGNLESLGGVFKNVLDYGLAGQKAKLAAGGYGNTGPSSYDRILNSTMTASNLNPVLNTIYGSLGRDATQSTSSRQDQQRYLLNLFQKDPLTGYLDNATAGRVYNPYLTRQGIVAGDIGNMGNIGTLTRDNTSGFEVIPGLASRANNMEAGFWNSTNSAIDAYSSLMGGGAMGGMSGGGGGGGGGIMSMLGGMGSGGGQANPNAASYNPYQSVGWNSGGAQSGPAWYSQPTPYGGTYGPVGVGYSQPMIDPQMQNFYNRLSYN